MNVVSAIPADSRNPKTRKKSLIRKHISPFKFITLSFLAVIAIGTLLLCLPISASDGKATPFINSLFTATSATCVTGLSVYDTATHWSGFGQAVLLILIQLGGLGIITMSIGAAIIARKKIGLTQRNTMQESIAAPQLGGIVQFTSFMLKTVVVTEVVGALALMPVFCRDFGAAKGIWYSVFHSVSAFCNAGFDLMGCIEPGSSLSFYCGNVTVITVISLLIVIGGIGFLTINDIITHKWHLSKYRTQSKVILTTSFLLIILPFLYYRFAEFTSPQWAHLTSAEKTLSALFQPIVARTAGFYSVAPDIMGDVALTIFIILMLIGGSPGSTAGGMKTTTAAVLFASVSSVFKREDSPHLFGRRINSGAVRSAATIVMLYVSIFIVSAALIASVEGLGMKECMFETASAIATVGSTLGITSQLSAISKLILIILMYLGRVGTLTLVYAAINTSVKNMSKYPEDKINIG